MFGWCISWKIYVYKSNQIKSTQIKSNQIKSNQITMGEDGNGLPLRNTHELKLSKERGARSVLTNHLFSWENLNHGLTVLPKIK